jgi:hypothetical protein
MGMVHAYGGIMRIRPPTITIDPIAIAGTTTTTAVTTTARHTLRLTIKGTTIVGIVATATRKTRIDRQVSLRTRACKVE